MVFGITAVLAMVGGVSVVLAALTWYGTYRFKKSPWVIPTDSLSQTQLRDLESVLRLVS